MAEVNFTVGEAPSEDDPATALVDEVSLSVSLDVVFSVAVDTLDEVGSTGVASSPQLSAAEDTELP
jgi:hypothetical protein